MDMNERAQAHVEASREGETYGERQAGGNVLKDALEYLRTAKANRPGSQLGKQLADTELRIVRLRGDMSRLDQDIASLEAIRAQIDDAIAARGRQLAETRLSFKGAVQSKADIEAAMADLGLAS